MRDSELKHLDETLNYLIIGEKATSYKMPLIVEYFKNYDDKICVETKNIKGKYIVFDKISFLNAVKEYNNNGEPNGNKNNKEEKT